MDALTADAFETAHGGYAPVYANDNPDRVVPVDALRQLEKEVRIGRLIPNFYSTVGNGTSVANAKNYAADIGNLTPEVLAEIPQPWYANPVEAKREGRFGEIFPLDDLIAMMKIADAFYLVVL